MQVGDILASFDGKECEELPHDALLTTIRKTPSPHDCEFKRYDMRFITAQHKWFSLRELRLQNVLLEDPRTAGLALVDAAQRGDLAAVKKSVLQGTPVESSDFTGATPLHAAATGNHVAIIKLLQQTYFAKVDSRDKDLVTPMLAAIRRCARDSVSELLLNGASRRSSDRFGRTPLYYSIRSTQLHLVRTFASADTVNQSEDMWKWTSLHVAAAEGNVEITKVHNLLYSLLLMIHY